MANRTSVDPATEPDPLYLKGCKYEEKPTDAVRGMATFCHFHGHEKCSHTTVQCSIYQKRLPRSHEHKVLTKSQREARSFNDILTALTAVGRDSSRKVAAAAREDARDRVEHGRVQKSKKRDAEGRRNARRDE